MGSSSFWYWGALQIVAMIGSVLALVALLSNRWSRSQKAAINLGALVILMAFVAFVSGVKRTLVTREVSGRIVQIVQDTPGSYLFTLSVDSSERDSLSAEKLTFVVTRSTFRRIALVSSQNWVTVRYLQGDDPDADLKVVEMHCPMVDRRDVTGKESHASK